MFSFNCKVPYGPWWNHLLEFWEKSYMENILIITYEELQQVRTFHGFSVWYHEKKAVCCSHSMFTKSLGSIRTSSVTNRFRCVKISYRRSVTTSYHPLTTRDRFFCIFLLAMILFTCICYRTMVIQDHTPQKY